MSRPLGEREMEEIKSSISQDKIRAKRNQSIFFAIVCAVCGGVLTVINVGPDLKDTASCMRGIVWFMSVFSAVIAVMMSNRMKS